MATKNESSRVQKYVDGVVRHLESDDALRSATVLLIGSAARNCLSPRSDIDVLVISDKPIERWRTPFDLHLQLQTRRAFLQRVEDKDDFALWALRNGRLVSDDQGWFEGIKGSSAAKVWPAWDSKVEYARRRLRSAERLLEIGDCEAAAEELLYSSSHVARALLLKNGVFPLSRPELPKQLERIGANELADSIKTLIYNDIGQAETDAIRAKIAAELEGIERSISRA